MTHTHAHDHCKHENMAFCQQCQAAYCKDCTREWKDCTFNHFPYQWWYQSPTVTTGTDTIGTSSYTATVLHSHEVS